MNNDVLILTIYFLVVIFVLYQMALSVERNLTSKLKITLNQDALEKQTNEQLEPINQQFERRPHPQKITATVEEPEIEGIKLPPQLELCVESENNSPRFNKIVVKVGPMGKMPMGMSLKDLSLNVRNATSDAQVFIDWDKSTIMTGMGRRAQRVMRSNIPVSSALPQPQVLSVIYPGEFLATQVTGESCISLDPESNTLKASKPLVEMQDLTDVISEMMEEFGADGVRPLLAYSLRLMLGIRQVTELQENRTVYLQLLFDFQATLLPDQVAFPPLRWLLNNIRPADARTLILGRPPKR